MARTLEEFPAPTGQQRYPWDQWLDGRVWELTQGTDFAAKPSTFRTNAQLQASKRGGTAKTRSLKQGDAEVVVLQFRRN